MIEERYVNPEVARLLRDKGFNEECDAFYVSDDTLYFFDEGSCFDNTAYSWIVEASEAEKYAVAPTQQRACDWMQTKDILIAYDLVPIGAKLMIKVYRKVYDDHSHDWVEATTIIRSTLEDAINEALKFVLEKLL